MTNLPRVLALAFLVACHGELVPIDDVDVDAGDAVGATPTWTGDAARRLERCTSCHGDAGRYSLESYRDSLGAGTDAVPNVVAGDASSALVDYCRRGHGGIGAADTDVIERWILQGAREQ